MRLIDIAKYSAKNLLHRQARSYLTVLGIVIGIAAVVALLTIGLGFNAALQEELSGFGYNILYVLPYSQSQLSSSGFGGGALPPSSGKLTEKDVDRLEKLPEVEFVSRGIERRATVEFKDKTITSVITGIEPGVYEKTTSIEVGDGRFLVESDRHVAVIGATVSEETFGQENQVRTNNFLLINGAKYRVIGILKKSASAFGSEIDSGIFVAYEDAREIFRSSLAKGEMDYVAASLAEGSDTDSVVERLQTELDSERKVKPDERDYTVMTLKTIQESIGQVLSLVTLFLGAVAAISLLVGGLAIATSMFTSVIQRTHEIGVLKAVGAGRDDIMRIFLFESGAVGLIGGALGTALGMGVVYLGSFFGLPADFQPSVAAFGVLFATVIGLLSGFVPARMAAKMNPVDALRYE